MDDNKEGKGGIRVVDRRRFDNDGNERVPEESATTVPKAEKPRAPTPPKNENLETTDSKSFVMDESNNLSDADSVTFGAFVMSLATQALVQLGDMQPPPGMEIPKDPEAARQTIDILSMLQGKTKGNLESVEVRLLEDILHNLRISYLRHQKSKN